MTGKLFIEGGYVWLGVPTLDELPWGRARHVFEYLVQKVRDQGESILLFTRDVADELDVSMRYVQLAIAELIREGFLASNERREYAKGGRTIVRRVLTMLKRPRGKERKARPAKPEATKIFSPVDERTCAVPPNPRAHAHPSFEGTQVKEQQAPGGGESDGTDPPPGLGEEAPMTEPPSVPTTAAEIRALMMAAAAEVAPPEPATRPTPSPMASAARRPVGETLAERKRRAEPLAQQGDRAAMAELAEIERAMNRGPTPPSMPPPVESEPPRSDRRLIPGLSFGRLLATWLRKKLE